MSQPPPIPSKSSSWWSTNWKWVVPTVIFVTCGGGLVPIAQCTRRAIKKGGFGAFAGEKPADLMNRKKMVVAGDPRVTAQLGTPVTESGAGSSFTQFGSSASVSFTQTLTGPKGTGTVRYDAEYRDGKWEEKEFFFKGPDGAIDFRATAAPAVPAAPTAEKPAP